MIQSFGSFRWIVLLAEILTDTIDIRFPKYLVRIQDLGPWPFLFTLYDILSIMCPDARMSYLKDSRFSWFVFQCQKYFFILVFIRTDKIRFRTIPIYFSFGIEFTFILCELIFCIHWEFILMPFLYRSLKSRDWTWLLTPETHTPVSCLRWKNLSFLFTRDFTHPPTQSHRLTNRKLSCNTFTTFFILYSLQTFD